MHVLGATASRERTGETHGLRERLGHERSDLTACCKGASPLPIAMSDAREYAVAMPRSSLTVIYASSWAPGPKHQNAGGGKNQRAEQRPVITFDPIIGTVVHDNRGIEYEPLFNQSVAFGCQRHLMLGLTVLSQLRLLREPLPEAVQKFRQTIRGPERLAERVFQAINAPRDWSQHPLRNYLWTFKLGGWRVAAKILKRTISLQPDDAFGRGFIQAHCHRWYRVFRVFAKYLIILPWVFRQRPALGSVSER